MSKPEGDRQAECRQRKRDTVTGKNVTSDPLRKIYDPLITRSIELTVDQQRNARGMDAASPDMTASEVLARQAGYKGNWPAPSVP